jgi:hypothetical protein
MRPLSLGAIKCPLRSGLSSTLCCSRSTSCKPLGCHSWFSVLREVDVDTRFSQNLRNLKAIFVTAAAGLALLALEAAGVEFTNSKRPRVRRPALRGSLRPSVRRAFREG